MVSDLERVADRERWWSIHDAETYTCPDCGRTSDHPEFRRWELHHLNGEAGTCVAVCARCHQVRHGAERTSISLEWWKEGFLRLGE